MLVATGQMRSRSRSPTESLIVSDSREAAAEAENDVRSLGVTRVSTDGIRPFGRAAGDQRPSVDGLCGHCGDRRAAIGPDGDVPPCVFSGSMNVGNVRTTGLAGILSGPELTDAAATIRTTRQGGERDPNCDPNAECTPGFPASECTPRN
ncbi:MULTISPECIES: SPASM domain-containing protein [unclassified Streptomyces]|uniref:SPASM domain-containing protein n=2 Tax=unclassified Streptomyces TaxID=2593676 RepID=UPI000CD5BAB5